MSLNQTFDDEDDKEEPLLNQNDNYGIQEESKNQINLKTSTAELLGIIG